MNYKNTLEEIKKEMRIRAITDELLAEQNAKRKIKKKTRWYRCNRSR